MAGEPRWEGNCTCQDCVYQRGQWGYVLINDEWVKK